MLQRIYATSWWTREELEQHLFRLEEAKRRDHRKLGRELGLFTFLPEAPGSPLYLPAGYLLHEALETYTKERLREGDYRIIKTPHVLSANLWHQSGHWEHYRDNMFFTEAEGQTFALKPMNCPGSTFAFRADLRSYRDLPLRLAEFGLCHRFERSGVLTGMLRVRSFTQDDAHLYCTDEQIEPEVRALLRLCFRTYRDLGFSDIRLELSTRPAKSTGTAEQWQTSESALAQALAAENLDYKVNPGDGAFYGPKVDFHIKDSIGRSWQMATVQLDFGIAERFDLSYVAADGGKRRPVVIHRAVLGSFERMIGVLIEHYAGAFPAWLAPVQAVVLPVSSAKFGAYAAEAAAELRGLGLKAEADLREESLNYRIRSAQERKVPYMLVVGGREAEARTVSVRRRDGGEGGVLPLAELGAKLEQEVRSRSLELTIGLPKAPAAKPEESAPKAGQAQASGKEKRA
jgi:threonyl-tRNA synthetase